MKMHMKLLYWQWKWNANYEMKYDMHTPYNWHTICTYYANEICKMKYDIAEWDMKCRIWNWNKGVFYLLLVFSLLSCEIGENIIRASLCFVATLQFAREVHSYAILALHNLQCISDYGGEECRIGILWRHDTTRRRSILVVHCTTAMESLSERS